MISSQDLAGLRDLWNHLETRLFNRLEPVQCASVSKLEAGLLKLFVVNCISNKKPEKLKEFFDKMTPELHHQHEWRDWFALPFIINPETHPTFAPYFSRQWQDTLLLSLYNFLSLIFGCLPLPKLIDFNSTNAKIKALKEENAALRRKLVELARSLPAVDRQEAPMPDVPPPQDVMDDFFIIAQETNIQTNPTADNQVKGLKGFLRTLTSNPATPSNAKTNDPTKKSKLGTVAENPKSRSSSKSRAKHAPLARLSQGSSSLLKGVKNDENEARLAFLLLSQEEYGEHHSEVTQCKFSRGLGNVVASSDVDGVVKIWSATPGSPHTLATFISNSGVHALDWIGASSGSATDRYFVYGTVTGTIRICDQLERKTCHELHLEGTCVSQLECNANGSLLAAMTAPDVKATEGGSLEIYDLRTSTKLEHNFSPPLSGGPQPVFTSCRFNHNSQMITTGASDGKIRIFDLRRRDCISSWNVSNEAILTIQPSSDDTSCYVMSANGEFTNWSIVQTSQKVFGVTVDDSYFEQCPRNALGAAFSFTGDDRHILACSTNGGVIYEAQTMDKVLGLRGHSTYVTCVDWSHSTDHGPCVTAGCDGQIRVSTLLCQ